MSKVKCEICNKEFETIHPLHLKTHNTNLKDYKIKYPNSKTISEKLKKDLSKAGTAAINVRKKRGTYEKEMQKAKETFKQRHGSVHSAYKKKDPEGYLSTYSNGGRKGGKGVRKFKNYTQINLGLHRIKNGEKNIEMNVVLLGDHQ